MEKARIKEELIKLISDIHAIIVFTACAAGFKNLCEYTDQDLISEYEADDDFSISQMYNVFYTKACKILSLILPERIDEFKNAYIKKDKPNSIIDNYTISLFFNNRPMRMAQDKKTTISYVMTLMKLQENILTSALELLDSVLYNIETEIQYNFYKDELAGAEHLLSKNFVKPAGVVAGVALESHLKNVCLKYPQIKIGAKDTLSKFIEHLKKADIIDTTMFKKIIFLADIRNLCAHKAEREATKEEVQDLIIGAKKILVDVN